MESKELQMSGSDVHNDTAEDFDGPNSDKDEVPCCSSGTICFQFDFYVV